MSALAMKPPPVALALLALAAVYYFTRRKSVTSGPGGTAYSTGTGRTGGTSGTSGTGNPLSFLRPSNTITPRTAQASQPANQQNNLISQGIGLVQSMLNLGSRASAAQAQAPTVTYDTGPLNRAVDYTPAYTVDTSGEAAAQEYFFKNPDDFIANIPDIFVYNDGFDPNGGYLDNQ